MEVTTYAEMNGKIAGLLRISDQPVYQYAAQYIEELRGECNELAQMLEMTTEALSIRGCVCRLMPAGQQCLACRAKAIIAKAKGEHHSDIDLETSGD